MRKYKTFDGEVVDLDWSTTYEHLPSDCKVLDDLMFKEIGYALCYMDYFHPEMYNGINDSAQRDRIELIIKDFCYNRVNHYNDVLWYQEKLFLFQDETENMC